MAGPPKVERTSNRSAARDWRKVRNTVQLARVIRPPRLRDSAPEGMAIVADEFQQQHRVLNARMKRAQHIVNSDPAGSQASGAESALVRARNEVLRERFPAVPNGAALDRLNTESPIRGDFLLHMKWSPWRNPPTRDRKPQVPVAGNDLARPQTGDGHGKGGQGRDGPQRGGSGRRLQKRGSSRMGAPPLSRTGGPPKSPSRSPTRPGSGAGSLMETGIAEPLLMSDARPEPGMLLGDGTVAVLPTLVDGTGGSRRGFGSLDSGGRHPGADDGADKRDALSTSGGGAPANRGDNNGQNPAGHGTAGKGSGTGARGSGRGLSAGDHDGASGGGSGKGGGNGHGDGNGDGAGGSGGDGRGEGGGRDSAGNRGEERGGVSPASPFPDFSDFDDDDDDFEVEPDFDPMATIWATRAKWSDAKSLYDTPSIETTRFENDWKIVQAIGATKEIGRQPNQAPDEVFQVGEVLRAHHQTLCLVFAYYASYSDELHYLTVNAWTQLTEDFKFVKSSSKFCKRSDLDRLFISIDTMSIMLEKEQIRAVKAATGSTSNVFLAESDRQKALSRIEFLGALVHLAIFRYVKTGEMADVSEALERLIGIDMESRLHPRVIALPDRFRRRYAYTPDVVFVLEWYEESLRNIFDVLCAVSFGPGSSVCNLLGWRNAMSALNLLSGDLAERDITLCFSWSRMCVGDSKTPAGSKKDSTLPFEGFLEAICRMAMMKALPTDDEITAAECEDAATYLAQLELVDTTGYEQLLLRKTPWGADQKRQPPHRCVAHLIALMLRAVKVSKAEDDGTEVELFVSQAEAGRWQKRKFAASSGRMC